MSLVDKILEIDHLIHADTGLGFIKIRMMLEDVEKEVAKGNPLAIKLENEIDHLIRFLKKACETEFGD